MSHLTIYRASAGSGKTYTLTGEYIALLLRYTDYHRRMLAVTFTNKATEEMKSRIVRDLHRISIRYDAQYIRKMAAATGVCEEELPARAADTLVHLLHDYSHFSILTIDSFFQRIIRAFAREMGLYAGYNVELDHDSVLDSSTNLLLDDIDSNDFLKDWLVEWAKRKIEEGLSWNFKPDVMRLGSEIFGEELQNTSHHLLAETMDRKGLDAFRFKLQHGLDSYRAYLQSYAGRAINIMTQHGLDAGSFFQKETGVAGYFVKWAKGHEAATNKYVMQALDDVEKWYSKTSKQKAEVAAAYDAGMGEILRCMIDFQHKHQVETATAVAVLKQISVLGILHDLMQRINEYTRDHNLFLLPKASGFLKTIIDNADTPFIYERTGNFYNHFMIDEFQDTSFIQWGNFRPLITNSIAQGFRNWIVGDVKQSIYRWRNTDWKILSEQVERDLGSLYVQVHHLEYNWRSTPAVVHFNNAFFGDAVAQMCTAFTADEQDIATADNLHILTDMMTEAYGDYRQKVNSEFDISDLKTGGGCTPHKPDLGYVHIHTLPLEKESDETWRDRALEQLIRRIEELQDLGYALSDIAILVRKNEEAQAIADRLTEWRQAHPASKYRYDVLSNESLLIGHSPTVKWLVAAMRYTIEPDDTMNRAYLLHEYTTYIAPAQTITLWTEEELQQLRSLPVYELSDRLIRQYGLYRDTGQAPFVQAFQDILLQYTRREATDVHSFLVWWEGEKGRKCVTMPDSQDAIRLITIHKSKGLEFNAVIIPFCDWELCKPGKILWCRPAESPFNDMKLLPLKFDSGLRNTIFVKEYLYEKLQSYIDNLNLLYVAFTRACKALFIITPQPAKDKFTTVKDVIHRIFHQPLPAFPPSSQDTDSSPNIHLVDFWSNERSDFELGVLTAIEPEKDKTHTGETTSSPINFKHMGVQPQYLMPNIAFNSARFTATATGNVEMDRGRRLHDIFRNIITVADLEHCLNTAVIGGRLPETEREQIVKTVRRAINNPIVSRWFAPDVRVKTEAEILLSDGKIARPDRIVFIDGEVQVIDFKFGKFVSDAYRQQVKHYMELLHGMGHASVRGFLWYVALNRVEEL